MDLMSYNIYLHLFNEFINDFPVNHLVYVNTSSSICSERIVKRDRKGENLNVRRRSNSDWNKC